MTIDDALYCPSCGNTALLWDKNKNTIFCADERCGLHGSYGMSDFKTIAFWNNMPRRPIDETHERFIRIINGGTF